MSRVTGVDPHQAGPSASEIFQKQEDRWGEALKPYLVYARRPSLLRAVRGMWDALSESGLLPGTLTPLICRRVAALNGCVF